jgi:hypothetical protein
MDAQRVCTDLGRLPEVKTLLGRATARHGTEDGVIIQFPGDDATARTVLEFVLAERRCCAQFTYEISFAPPNEQLALRLRADGPYLAALKATFA